MPDLALPSPTAAVEAIRARAPGFAPRLGLVLGSGLAAIADRIEVAAAIAYGDIPGFARPSIEGHAGRLLLGKLAGLPVACLQGRVHLYEGASAEAIRLPVRALKLLGCDMLLLTNAAGSLRPEVGGGSLMLISDHINLQGGNPLVGANDESFGPRFLSLEDAYDPALRRRLRRAAADAAVALHDGVYLALLGPVFETPAEIRAFARLGADAVGMSTVPEVIVARHCGLRVAAISVITNLAVGLGGPPLDHAQTLAAAEAAAERLGQLLTTFCGALRRDG